MNIYELTQIINKRDPLHFIELGAPDDEYQPEIGDIFVALREKSMDETELVEKMKEIFTRWFNASTANSISAEVYKNLAHDILMKEKGTAHN